MAKTRVATHKGNGIALLRDAVTTADSSTINDTNFPPGSCTSCAGWYRVIIVPRFIAGTAPSVTVQILVRTGDSWAVQVAKTAALTEGQIAIIEVASRDIFFRVDAITGSPTSVSIYGGGWEQVDRSWALPDR